MPNDTPGREPAERGSPAAGGAPAAGEHVPSPSTERVGPLAVSRNLKRDGRRLLLFSRVDGASGDSAGDRAGAEAARGGGARRGHAR